MLGFCTQALVTPPMKEEGEQLRQELSETRAEVAALKGKLEAADEELLQVGLLIYKWKGVGYHGSLSDGSCAI